MTLKILAAKKSDKNIFPYTYNSEADAFIRFVKTLWGKYNLSDDACYTVADLNYPKIDMMVLTQSGIGVIEFKNHPGLITIGVNGSWYADEKIIHSGTSYENPHEQVLSYASKIYHTISPLPFLKSQNLTGNLKVQICVAFTNPKADISNIIEDQIDTIRDRENFRVINRDGFLEWVETLRFGVSSKSVINEKAIYDPFILGKPEMDFIMTKFDAYEWKELYEYMPLGKPYGYLLRWENGIRTSIEYTLKAEEVSIGRNNDICDIGFPEKSKVSRKHAMISRQINGIYIEDLESSNGTYINGIRIRKPEIINPNQRITLGGPKSSDDVCELEFSLGDSNAAGQKVKPTLNS